MFTGMTLRDSTVTKKTDQSRRSFSVSLNFRTVDYDGRQHLYDSAVDEDGSDDDASTTGHNVQHPQNHSACIQVRTQSSPYVVVEVSHVHVFFAMCVGVGPHCCVSSSS